MGNQTRGRLEKNNSDQDAVHFNSNIVPAFDPPVVQRLSEAQTAETASPESLQNNSTGQSLEPSAREILEPKFGHNFENIRIHSDTEADRLSQNFQAQAFTTGSDIFFRQGAYNPHSRDGLHWLAHELTHTIQQSVGPVSGTPNEQGVLVSDPSDSFEQAAEQTADTVMNSDTISPKSLGTRGSGGTLQRKALAGGDDAPVQAKRVSSFVGATIQRSDPPGATPAPGAPAPGTAPSAAPATWTPPFDLPAASKKYEAALRLIIMAQDLNELKESMGSLDKSQLESAVSGIQSLGNDMRSEDALTTDDVNKLEIVSVFAKTAADTGRQALSALISQALQSMFQADTGGMDNLQSDLDEEMRKSFKDGADPSRIAQIKSGMDAIGKYKGYADNVADWATKANSLLNSAKLKEYVEAFGKNSKKLGEGMKIVGQVLDAAKLITSLTTNQGPGQSANDIAKFEATLSGIDLVMGFAGAVPGLGQLWSGYYKPLTEACIKHMKYIFKMVDEQKRDLTLLEWETDQGKGRGPGGTPIIPALHMSAFPGGQSILNYMYPLVNGGGATMTPDVEQFFIAHKSLFNAGADSKDPIDTEWHFFKKDTSPNLVPWITKNASTVWAMLYGNMRKNI